MARARLHIICGNCGCDDDFTYKTFKATDGEDEPINEVQIICDNCGTIHYLSERMLEGK